MATLPVGADKVFGPNVAGAWTALVTSDEGSRTPQRQEWGHRPEDPRRRAPIGPPAVSDTAPSPGKRALKRTIFVVVMLFVVYYLILPQLARGGEAADLLGKVNPLLLLLALGLEISALLAYTVLTRVTLPPEPKLSLFTIFRIQLATRSVTNLVPGGSAAGGTLGYRLLTDAGVAPTSAGFSLATVGLGSAVVLNLILWLSLLVSIPFNGFSPAYVSAAIVGVILLASAAALVYLLMEGRGRAEQVLRAIARRTPFVKEDTASRFIHQLADRLQDLARQPELVRSGARWAAANWLLDAAALWVFLWAFGTTMNPINLIVAFGVAGVLAAIPITPGGLGVVETVLPTLLVQFGVPVTSAGIAVLGWRLLQFWLPIPLGGLSYASLKLARIGRRQRVATMRDLAQQAGQAATRRVWDEATGEYRLVATQGAPTTTSGTAEGARTDDDDDDRESA